MPDMSQIKFWCCDKWHGSTHTQDCPCRPSLRRLALRLRGVNTPRSEQVFSWFRMYARVLNEMREARDRFLVLLFCQQHNKMIHAGEALNHLPPAWARKGKHGGHYDCPRAMKRPSAAV